MFKRPQHRKILMERLLQGDSFTFVDIGARDFGHDFFSGAHHLMDLLAFEPDETEFKTLMSLDRQKQWRKMHLSQKGISGKEGPRELYLTKHRGCTSILRPKLEYANKYDRHEFFSVEKAVNIDTTTLEKALNEFKVKNPIFIKIDIEGAELEVLQSLDQSFSQILAIKTEVNFLPYREKQGKAGEILDLLQERGFNFVDVVDMGDYRYCGIGTSYPGMNRKPNGYPVYSKGDICASDFIFLKDPSLVPQEQLAAYAAICIELEQFDKAHVALSKLGDTESNVILHDYSAFLFKDRRFKDSLRELNVYKLLFWTKKIIFKLLGKK